MNFNFISLFLFYWLSIFSVVGYGILADYLLNNKKTSFSLGYQGLAGILLLIIYSYISNVFYPHTQLHNLFFFIIGLSLSVYFIFFKKRINFKELKLLFQIFLILFVTFLIFKTHDDFSYYHFQYSYYLTQFSSLLGIGHFNHGFNTPSSIFYLNSLFYLPVIKYHLFHIPVVLIFGFSNLILITKILNFIRKKEPNYLTYILLFSIIFINIFFYRLAEHGTDRSAQILIFILVYELILLNNLPKKSLFKFNKVFLLLSIIISLKAFYFLYLIVLAPILILGFLNFKEKFLKLIIKNEFFIILSISFFLVVATNIFNSGCLLFPVKFSCLESLPWAHSLEHVNHMNNWYEQWSKAGAGPNFRIDNPNEYIKDFNWVGNWIDEYFFNKVSDFLLGISLIIIILFFLFTFKTKRKKLKKLNFIGVYICLILLFFEWFYNHPSLRYGGYVLISLLFFIPTSIYFSKFKNKNFEKKIKALILVSFFILFTRNIDRINNEIEKYNYSPFLSPFFKVESNYYEINNNFEILVKNYNKCLKNNNCSDNEKKIGRFFGKIYFKNNQ